MKEPLAPCAKTKGILLLGAHHLLCVASPRTQHCSVGPSAQSPAEQHLAVVSIEGLMQLNKKLGCSRHPVPSPQAHHAHKQRKEPCQLHVSDATMFMSSSCLSGWSSTSYSNKAVVHLSQMVPTGPGCTTKPMPAGAGTRGLRCLPPVWVRC